MRPKETRPGAPQEERANQPYHMRLPGFISDDEMGLGEVIKRITTAVGIKPCDGCTRRVAALNAWFVFTRRR